MSLFLFPFYLVFGIISPARADCICQCVNGENIPICDSFSELAPQCAPELCPAVSFSIAPADEEDIGPIGTQRCSMHQVFEDGQYVWRQLCE